MEIVLKKSSDFRNTINKTFTVLTTLIIEPRKDFNIYSPELILHDGGFNYLDVTHVEINDLDRVYFVNDVERINSQLVKLNCEIDFLETYRSNILNLDCYYYREINSGDYGKVNLETTGEILTDNIVSSFSPEIEITNILSVLKQGVTQ